MIFNQTHISQPWDQMLLPSINVLKKEFGKSIWYSSSTSITLQSDGSGYSIDDQILLLHIINCRDEIYIFISLTEILQLFEVSADK